MLIYKVVTTPASPPIRHLRTFADRFWALARGPEGDDHPEPERFDIDRFSAARAEHKQPGAYAPFGLGPHRCLGAGMGELQTMIVMGRLLERFELALEPDSQRLEIVMKPLRRPARLNLRVVRRRR